MVVSQESCGRLVAFALTGKLVLLVVVHCGKEAHDSVGLIV
jgi:hypothetical protein